MTERNFKVGARTMQFPLPLGTLAENVAQMLQNFPVFRWTQVTEADGVPQADGSLLYELILPPTKANG